MNGHVAETIPPTRKPGNLASAFYYDTSNPISLPERYKELKASIIINPSSVQDSWKRLVHSFNSEIEKIRTLGPKIIPQVEFEEIKNNNGRFPAEVEKEIKARGCVVIKNVVNPEVALGWKADVIDYIQRNRDKITGFPESNPQVWEVYWSKAQVAARSHPNFNLAATAVNKLWHLDKTLCTDPQADLSKNVTYCDRLRIRKSGDSSFKLGEHVDGGSVERWEDPEYRKCYQEILNGNWENYDAFDATHRMTANMDLYNIQGGCSMFRSFQGWMSLSSVASEEGTLKLCPIIKHSTAYIILRPFLEDLFNTSSMAGSAPGAQQIFTQNLHSHILEAMVSIPRVEPGDCVFWHCDMVHAVEGFCKAKTDSSVFYIPATPLCSKNMKYVERQKEAFLNGKTPPDFPLNNCEIDVDDRAKESDLTDLGRTGMGF